MAQKNPIEESHKPAQKSGCGKNKGSAYDGLFSGQGYLLKKHIFTTYSCFCLDRTENEWYSTKEEILVNY
ncbi:hypothetical protein GCM10008922_36100 [Faecalicatena contorta]